MTPINSPSKGQANAVWRVLIKGAVGAVPVAGGLLAELAGEMIEDPNTLEHEQWQKQVTERLNDLASQLGVVRTPKTDLAWALGQQLWTIDAEAKGRVQVEEAVLLEACPNSSIAEIDEALAEMKHAGWITTWLDPNSRTGNGGFISEPFLFACIDPITRGTSPLDDASEIAEMLLLHADESIEAVQIDRTFGWENRRLYPALWLLANTALDDPHENYLIPDYPFPYCYLSGETRRKLRSMYTS